jgi:hypothetical protein
MNFFDAVSRMWERRLAAKSNILDEMGPALIFLPGASLLPAALWPRTFADPSYVEFFTHFRRVIGLGAAVQAIAFTFALATSCWTAYRWTKGRNVERT